MMVMYSKPNCPHCDGAEAWLKLHGFDYFKVDVTADPDALAFIKDKGHKTVPQFYVDDTLVVEGGFAGLRELGPDMLHGELEVLRGKVVPTY